MQPALAKVPNNSQSLTAQAQAVRTRTAALLASFRSIRQGAFETQRESRALKDACQAAMLECRAALQSSAAHRRSRTAPHSEAQNIAPAIARTLSELGIPAFVFEPPHDTAIQL